MRHIDSFNNWLNENHRNSDESWAEQYENLLIEFEEKMEKEGLKVKSLYSDLSDAADSIRRPGKHFVATKGEDDKFIEDIDTFMTNHYEDLYLIDMESVTPEYQKISKKAEQQYTKTFPTPNVTTTGKNDWGGWFGKKKRFINEALYRNIVEKNWEEYKNIYKKWLEYLDKRRGSLHGKKFGI